MESLKVFFLSQMHCTGEHGKAAKYLREAMDIEAYAGCTGPQNYLRYANDMGYGMVKRDVESGVKWCDCLVLEEGLPADYGFIASDLEGKVVVRDSHGTFTRRNSVAIGLGVRAQGIHEIYRTSDLRDYCSPGANYIPCSIDFADRLFHRQRVEQKFTVESTEALFISHAPTNREAKGTRILYEAVVNPRYAMPDTMVQIIEGQPNSRCLFERRNHKIYFDQIADGRYHGYFGVIGVAGIEAAAMMQVVLGNFKVNVDTEPMPCVEGMLLNDADGLSEILIRLRENHEYLYEMAKSWYEWAEKYRNRAMITKEFYKWMCHRSPCLSA